MQDADANNERTHFTNPLSASEVIRRKWQFLKGQIFWAAVFYPTDIQKRAKSLLNLFPPDPVYDGYLADQTYLHPTGPHLEYIDLDQELDLSKLKIDETRYWISFGGFSRRNRRKILDSNSSKINYRRNNGHWEEYRPDEFWRVSLRFLSLKHFRSDDLLNQILVLLTIKAAQSGDYKARDKLFELLRVKARGIARKFIATKFSSSNLRPKETGVFYSENVESVSDTILLQLIQGDTMPKLVDLLRDPGDVTMQLNRRIAKLFIQEAEILPAKLAAIEKSILQQERRAEQRWKRVVRKTEAFPTAVQKRAWAIMFPYMYSEHVDGKLDLPTIEELAKTFDLNLKEQSLARIIYDGYWQWKRFLYSQETALHLVDTMTNPYVMLSNHPEFNSMAYRPRKTAPFLVWLFGNPVAKDYGQRGAFQRKLNDWYKKETTTKKDQRTEKTLRIVHGEDIEGWNLAYDDELSGLETNAWADSLEETSEPIGSGKAVQSNNGILNPSQIVKLYSCLEKLKQSGELSSRDFAIYLYWMLRVNLRKAKWANVNQKTLGSTFGLTDRQIRRIIEIVENSLN